MQPRSGIRGVTVEDVANVAQNGSSVMRGGYTFTRGRRGPSLAPAGTTDVRNIIAGMTATPLNTAGLRYSGYPTASAQEAAVLGSIQPFYDVGEYARQLAQQNLGRIAEETASDIRRKFGPEDYVLNPPLELNPLSPVAAPGYGGVAPARVASQNVNDPAFRAAELAANKAWAELGIARVTGGTPARLAELQDIVDNGLELYPEEQVEYEQLWRQKRDTDRDLFAKQQAAEDAQAAFALASRNATSARLAGATGAAAQGQQRTFTEVAPLEQMAADIQAVPRYQLAQQMATQYFGMDPALAAGMFTPQVDIDYMDMMTDYQTAQNLAQGLDPNASTEDILLALDPSGQRLLDYQEQRAIEAENKLLEGARTAAEEQADIDILSNTGFSVKEAAGNEFSMATARGYLTDNDFIANINNAVATMQESTGLTAEDRKRVADNLAAQFMAEYADPVGARILLNILYGYTFTIPTE